MIHVESLRQKKNGQATINVRQLYGSMRTLYRMVPAFQIRLVLIVKIILVANKNKNYIFL